MFKNKIIKKFIEIITHPWIWLDYLLFCLILFSLEACFYLYKHYGLWSFKFFLAIFMFFFIFILVVIHVDNKPKF